ncbi:MAG: hypothetical protein EOO73_30050 [Myxococcales bacterium]|nr:MAG: hypothetical protein EOO73_30050 [Myxococcales bacterium]
MLPRWPSIWLVAAALLGVGACELNPQPDLPSRTGGAESPPGSGPILGSGGSSAGTPAQPGIDLPGGAAGGSLSAGGGGTVDDRGGEASGGAAAGGDSAGGAPQEGGASGAAGDGGEGS